MSDTEEMDELRGYVEDGLLSKIQVEILESKLKGAKYTEIEKFYDLSGPVALSHCLRRTALCLWWEPGLTTGPDPYLSTPDANRFRELIVQACDDVNCVTTAATSPLDHPEEIWQGEQLLADK